MRPGLLAFVFASTLVLGGCRGKILATAELPGPGKLVTVTLRSPGKVALWADTDGKWHDGDKMPVHFTIEVVSGGKSIGHVECNSQDAATSVCGTEVTVNDEHSANCELKMPCKLPPLPPGDVLLHVRADPGPNVESVKRIALNVRQD
jgi:hypothetical protein